MKRNFLVTLLICFFAYGLRAQQLAPAYPLVTHDPYFSIWSTTDQLNSSVTKHWTGFEQSLVGLVKVDGVTYRVLGEKAVTYETILPTSEEEGYTARYLETAPAAGWMNPDFDDAGWKSGAAPFTNNPTAGGSPFMGKEIWTRRTFNLEEAGDPEDLFLKINHDDYVEVYLNGELIYSCTCWLNHVQYFPVEKMKTKLKKGKNVMAIHCQNIAGLAWLDAGLSREVKDAVSGQVKAAVQRKCTLNATQTQYDFTCGGADVTLTFTSPLLPGDLNLISRPVSYISYKVKSNDNKQHEVDVYFGASSSIAVNEPGQAVTASQYTKGNLSFLKAGTVAQPVLQKQGDDLRIDWGYMYVGVSKRNGLQQNISTLHEAIGNFAGNGNAQGATAVANGKHLMLNTSVKLGKVGAAGKEQLFMLGYDDLYAIQYFGTNLKALWKEDPSQTIEKQFALAAAGYNSILKRCAAFNRQLHADAVAAGGEEYAKLCEIAYRQSIAAHKLVRSPQGDLLFLSKENFSNGSINTVDVTYPSAPLYLIYNPDLLKGMLNGIFYYSESGKWKKNFPAHDLGTYPLANGQTYGDDMPVEEAGNMVILTAAIARAEGNINYARKHWKTLSTWAAYLEKNGFDPADQLCTEDFSGRLARNANLSLKAIVALGCYADMAEQMGEKAIAAKYRTAAKEMVPAWMKLADDGDHYTLAFEKKGTWSQKYNLVWDKMFRLHLFPEEVFKKEISYYLTRQNEFGLPLDNRKTYTINYSVLWTAVLSGSKEEFEKFVTPIYKFATQTTSRVPLSDWSETTEPKAVGFQARSVVGGYFMKLFDYKINKKK